MPTIRLVPSSYSVSSSNRVSVSSPGNMYYNTDHTANYCSIRGRNSSSSTYYAFIKGFNFDDVPSGATVSSFSIKIRCYKNSYLQQGTTYRPRLASSNSNNNVISGTTLGSDVTTTAGGTVYTFPLPSSLTWATLKGYGANFSIEVPLRSSGNSYPYLYVYGAEIEVTYSSETVHVTGVTLDKQTDSIEVGETTTLTETVAPSNATDKSVSWSTSNSSVATVSGGVVTGVSAGSARITVTTNDGGYTAYCDVTVTPAVTYDYVQTDTLVDGQEYLIANGNSGQVYIMSGEANGAQTLRGIAATVTNGKLTVTGAIQTSCLFTCQYETSGNSSTAFLKFGSNYLYTDSSNGLRVTAWTSSMSGRHWHYKAESKHLLWFFNDASGGSDGYNDTSTTYKYYPEESGGNFTATHITSPSLADTATPPIYLFVLATEVPPTITVGTPSTSRISAITDHDQCVCTFTSDLALSQWEARATKAGVTPARGVGLLVESGGALAANTPAMIYVENEELTQGDGEYTITVYGLSTGGIWSE